jgi:hypothetical protein
VSHTGCRATKEQEYGTGPHYKIKKKKVTAGASCECSEQAVADILQGIVAQLGERARDNSISPLITTSMLHRASDFGGFVDVFFARICRIGRICKDDIYLL